MLIVRPTVADLESAHILYKIAIADAFKQEGLEDLVIEIEDEVAYKMTILKDSLMNPQSKYQFLVAKKDHLVVASISFGPCGKETTMCTEGALDHVGELGSLYVLPTYQSQGLGSDMISSMLLSIQSEGATQFCCDSGYSRAQKRWLNKFGTPYHIAKDFWGPGYDHYIWLVDIASQVKLGLEPGTQQRIDDILRATLKGDQTLRYHAHPGNLSFDRGICHENPKDMDHRLSIVTLNDKDLGILYLEEDETGPTGFFDWMPNPSGARMEGVLLKALPALFNLKMDLTMASAALEDNYQAIGFARGDYVRYCGTCDLENLESPEVSGTNPSQQSATYTIENAHQALKDLAPEVSKAIEVQIANLIGYATGETVSIERYYNLLQDSKYATAKPMFLLDWKQSDSDSSAAKEPLVLAYALFWCDLETRTAVLEPVACHGDYRRQGLAKVLLAQGLTELKQQGYQKVFVGTSQNNRASQALYTRVGFKQQEWLFTYKAVDFQALKQVDTIVFDLYGTLLDIHTDESNPSLWRRLAYAFAAKGAHYEPLALQNAYQELVSLAVAREQARYLVLTGEELPVEQVDIELLDVFKLLFQQKGITDQGTSDQGASSQAIDGRSLQEVATIFRLLSLDYVKPYPHAIELLELLKAKGLRVVLLSNAQSCFTKDELTATGLAGHFDSVYLSSDYQLCKPHKGYFEMMLEKEGLKAHQCLFIGNDHRTDIAGANSVGMPSLYMHTNCSAQTVPLTIPALWRVDSGSLASVLQLVSKLSGGNPVAQ